MSKNKLSQEEGIAVFVGIAVVTLFAPLIFVGVRSAYSASPAPEEIPNPIINQINGEAILEFETQDIVRGDGPVASFGDTVYVHYVGMFDNGQVFDLSTNRPTSVSVELGNGDVIPGWELGIAGMREGGTRRLTIPPELAYGKKGVKDKAGRVIVPEDATLVFDIILLRVDKDGEPSY